jgi:hypothetical protein
MVCEEMIVVSICHREDKEAAVTERVMKRTANWQGGQGSRFQLDMGLNERHGSREIKRGGTDSREKFGLGCGLAFVEIEECSQTGYEQDKSGEDGDDDAAPVSARGVGFNFCIHWFLLYLHPFLSRNPCEAKNLAKESLVVVWSS